MVRLMLLLLVMMLFHRVRRCNGRIYVIVTPTLHFLVVATSKRLLLLFFWWNTFFADIGMIVREIGKAQTSTLLSERSSVVLAVIGVEMVLFENHVQRSSSMKVAELSSCPSVRLFKGRHRLGLTTMKASSNGHVGVVVATDNDGTLVLA